jgi:hypothetical protein
MQLTELYVHPLKSCRGNAVPEARVEPMGLAHDRRWMLVTGEGRFMTGRQFPRMVLIEVAPDDTGATFTAPGMDPLRVPLADMTEPQATEVWGDAFVARAGSLEADFWFSDFLGSSCRLLHVGADTTRRTDVGTVAPVGFADGFPLLLIGQASLDDLNGRLATPVTMRHFRTNLVVQTTRAFEEDGWQRIRIGEVEFEHAKPCTRCIFTTVDPDTAVPAADRQPLQTLNGYRQFDDGTRFGINLIALNQGVLRIGDPLEVLG